MNKTVKIAGTLCIAALLAASCYSNWNINISFFEKSDFKDSKKIDSKTLDQYNVILTNAGTPEDVLNSFSDNQKKFIVDNLKENAVYESSQNHIYMPDPDGQNKWIPTTSASNSSENLIQITISNYTVSMNGEKQQAIFPSFQWLKNGHGISDDSFSFTLYDDWETTIDSGPYMTVYLNKFNGSQKTVNYNPDDADIYGSYTYRIPSKDGKSIRGSSYEGYAVFYAKKTKKNATNGMSVRYVHDPLSSVPKYIAFNTSF